MTTSLSRYREPESNRKANTPGIIGGISIMGIPGFIFGPLFIALLSFSYQILIDQLTLIG